jgi:hypothetical protein
MDDAISMSSDLGGDIEDPQSMKTSSSAKKQEHTGLAV